MTGRPHNNSPGDILRKLVLFGLVALQYLFPYLVFTLMFPHAPECARVLGTYLWGTLVLFVVIDEP